MEYLLDTNVIINFLEASLPENAMSEMKIIVDNRPQISVITKMETLGFNFLSAFEQESMETFINYSEIQNLNNEIVNKTIELRKQKKISLPDAIIAATAIVNNLILITRNVKDFSHIEEIKIVNPFFDF
jgi:predicted nucleic acid-binding protein